MHSIVSKSDGIRQPVFLEQIGTELKGGTYCDYIFSMLDRESFVGLMLKRPETLRINGRPFLRQASAARTIVVPVADESSMTIAILPATSPARVSPATTWSLGISHQAM